MNKKGKIKGPNACSRFLQKVLNTSDGGMGDRGKIYQW